MKTRLGNFIKTHGYTLLYLLFSIISIVLLNKIFSLKDISFFKKEDLFIQITIMLGLSLFPIIASSILLKYFTKSKSIIYLLSNFIINNAIYITIGSLGFNSQSILVIVIGELFNLTYLVLLNNIFSYKSMQLKKDIEEKELTMMQTSSKIMLGQMKPHFMYNTLNTIKYLISEDPKKAEYAIVAFSDYLRANMNSINDRKFIIFEEELNHVKKYVSIELLRFEDKINISYDIKSSDFFIPSLCVQPLVENAIKHGITRRINGGHIWVNSRKEKKNYIIEVIDDGIGFDLAKLNETNDSIAIKNIRERINIIPNASFTIESEINKGTKCTIIIPDRIAADVLSIVKVSESD